MKKHKKNMRTYENCFSSTDAVDWLQKSLQKNPNFGAEVTKEQTVLLLQKLYRAGIIENVREDSNDEEFKVNFFISIPDFHWPGNMISLKILKFR